MPKTSIEPRRTVAEAEPIPVLIPELPMAEELLPFLRRIDAARWYSNYGPLWREFSSGLAGFVGRHTGQTDIGITFASSGTTAIELALRVRARPGARFCLMPSFTFIASAHAVSNAGLVPYLLDAAAALTSLERIGHQPLCVSLHATKVFGIGEGGAIISDDPALISRTTAMTGFGFAPHGGSRVSELRGGNYRISEYAAAVGLAALVTVERKIDTLRAITGDYARGLRNGPIRLQRGAGARWVTMTLNVVLPPGEVDDTLRALDTAKVEWRRWWGLGCHTHPAFAELPRSDLGTTTALAPRVIGVPFHTTLTPAQVARVCTCLNGRLS